MIHGSVAIAPRPGDNEVDATGVVSADSIAQEIVRSHQAGLRARRERDLISEKLLLHIDGSGDFQWAEIYHGQRVVIPRLVSEFRKTENVLRIVVDNAVAHHTTMPLRFFAEHKPDRHSRDEAAVNTLFANHLTQQQDLNSVFSDCLYMSMATGFCPVHGYWRDDAVIGHEPISGVAGDSSEAQIEQLINPKQGVIDCWTGNPFDMVFDRGARRGSIHSATYGRILPANLVKAHFDHIPGVSQLQGTTRMPTASIFQRIARAWQTEGVGVHGSPVIRERQNYGSDEELMTVICREILPGVSSPGDGGVLQMVIVPEAVDLRRGEGRSDHALLVVDQALPAGDYSWTNFYSHHRADDVHGKPWVEDIDQLQVDLNIALSKRWEVINRQIDAPIVAPGGAIDEDMADIGPYQLLEIDPQLAGWRPQVMQWPPYIVEALDKEIEDRRKAIYTGGGYQAASRGESGGTRQPYRAIVALQQADASIHGPVNKRFQRSGCDFLRLCWKQMKTYGDVPWMVDVAGDEYAHVIDGYIDKTKLSTHPPKYKLVNAFGASPEMQAQEITELMQLAGADGVPFLTTEEARRLYPNNIHLFDTAGDPKTVQRRRARTVASKFHDIARELRQKTGFDIMDMNHPWVQQAAHQVFLVMEGKFPRLRDDDLESHLAALSEIIQDETADPVARQAAIPRQNLYYEWQAEMAAAALPVEGQAGGQGQAGPINPVNRTGVARDRAAV